MKSDSRLVGVLISAGLIFNFCLIGNCQENETTVPKEKVIALAKRIEAQQAQIEANQIKIERQIAEIHEIVRQAWVFSRRASR